jgi:anaerobic magnesium-protoporphyrin IX monomethyl ester cyclase
MLDLLIINPMAAHGIYGPLGDELVAVEPPLWCRLCAGYVRDKGFSVQILDAEALRLDADAAADATLLADPRLICIAVYGHQPSASTQQMWGASLLARAIVDRQRSNFSHYVSDSQIVMIGGHPSALPEQTLNDEWIHFVGIGEGPRTLVGLLENKPYDLVPGLVWKQTRIRKNSMPALIEDMRELHGYTWDLLPMEKYRAHNWQCFGDLSKRTPYASIYTSLGCPYKCAFCCINAPFASNRYRMRNTSDVVDEIEFLYEEYNIETFKITDEMFILNEHHYTEICQGLISRKLGSKINVWAYSRVDTVDQNFLALLRSAGIRWLALGIESGSALVRNGAKKKLKTDDIVGTVKKIQNAGINVIGNFMFGLRDDSMETMQQTFDLAIECMPDFANFYCTMAYPGSALFDQAVKSKWTLPESWRGYSQHNADCRPLDTEHVSGASVLEFRDRAFGDFFTHSGYTKHIRNKFGEDTVTHIDRMLGYKLKRKLLVSS